MTCSAPTMAEAGVDQDVDASHTGGHLGGHVGCALGGGQVCGDERLLLDVVGAAAGGDQYGCAGLGETSGDGGSGAVGASGDQSTRPSRDSLMDVVTVCSVPGRGRRG